MREHLHEGIEVDWAIEIKALEPADDQVIAFLVVLEIEVDKPGVAIRQCISCRLGQTPIRALSAEKLLDIVKTVNEVSHRFDALDIRPPQGVRRLAIQECD